MKEIITNHPLRNITLRYDDAKPETEYEKNLLREYIVIHDQIYALKKSIDSLSYEYTEWYDTIPSAEKNFTPISVQMRNLFEV